MGYSALVGECGVVRGGVEEDREGENGEELPPGVDLWGSGRDRLCRSVVRKETRRERRKRREEEECTGVIPANTRIALSIL